MKEQLVSLDVARLAKEKGFDEYVWDYWSEGKSEVCSGTLDNGKIKWNSDSDYFSDKIFAAPTQSLLQKWLRDVHKIHIELLIDGWGEDDCVKEDFLCYRAFVWKVGEPRPLPWHDIGANLYEPILEEALKAALALI